MNDKLTPEQFIMLAIEKLAPPGRETIHTVFSGFNEAFREYFKDEGFDPVVEVNNLFKVGKVSFRLAKGGAIIAKPGVIQPQNSGADALKKMGDITSSAG